MHFSTLSLALYASLAVAAIQPGRHFRERRQEDNGTISTTTEAAAAIITEAPELLKGNNDAAVPVDNVPVVDIPVAQNETVVDNAAVVAPVANAEVVEPVANAEVIEPIAKGNTTVAPEVVAAVPIVTGEAPAPEVVAPIAVETTPAAALNGTLAPQTTLTVSVTEVETITSCAETVTDCAATAPGQAVVTTTIKVLTTVCPVAEISSASSALISSHSSAVAATGTATVIAPPTVAATASETVVPEVTTQVLTYTLGVGEKTTVVTSTYTSTIFRTVTTEPARTEVPLAENEQAAPVVDGAESEETTTSTTTVYSISTLFETVIVQPTDASGNQATVTGGAEGVGATAVASNESQVDGPVCSPAAGCFPVTVTVTEPAACVAPTASVTETSTVTMTQTASTVTVTVTPEIPAVIADAAQTTEVTTTSTSTTSTTAAASEETAVVEPEVVVPAEDAPIVDTPFPVRNGTAVVSGAAAPSGFMTIVRGETETSQPTL